MQGVIRNFCFALFRQELAADNRAAVSAHLKELAVKEDEDGDHGRAAVTAHLQELELEQLEERVHVPVKSGGDQRGPMWTRVRLPDRGGCKAREWAREKDRARKSERDSKFHAWKV
jgi:hypothetical protein